MIYLTNDWPRALEWARLQYRFYGVALTDIVALMRRESVATPKGGVITADTLGAAIRRYERAQAKRGSGVVN